MKPAEKILRMIAESETVLVPVSEASHLYTDLGYDSLAFVCLLLKIEEVFSIRFELPEMDSCLRADRLIALVEQKTKESAHD